MAKIVDAQEFFGATANPGLLKYREKHNKETFWLKAAGGLFKQKGEPPAWPEHPRQVEPSKLHL
jgi:hypothetical protein